MTPRGGPRSDLPRWIALVLALVVAGAGTGAAPAGRALPDGTFRAEVKGEVNAALEGLAAWFHPMEDSLGSYVIYLAAGDSAFVVLDGDVLDLERAGSRPVTALPARYEPLHPGAFLATLTWLSRAEGPRAKPVIYRSLGGAVVIRQATAGVVEASFDLTATADPLDSPDRHAIRLSGEFRATRP